METIDNLNIINIQRQIKLLKMQSLVKIDEKIAFNKNIKLNTLHKKITSHNLKLKEYEKAVKKIYNTTKNSNNTAALTISSIQMVNYENLMMKTEDKVEDLKIEIEIIKKQTIPNLERKKRNIEKDTLRKLEYALNIELPNKKHKLTEVIEQLNYNKSEQNIQNSKVIGKYVIKDYPVKPKKKLIVVVAFITGLMLSVFLAFFLEFIQGGRKEEMLKA